MTLTQQLHEAFYKAPLSLAKMKKNSFQWMAVYLSLGIVVFGVFTWLLISNEATIKNLLLDHFFPKSWHQISEQLAAFLFETQAKIVIGNMIIGGSLVLASMVLFPIKEKYSAAFEKDAQFNNGESREFPLWQQAWEETKLFLFYLTAQLIILWLGYYAYNWTKILSISLSYLFLFFTFGIDFIAPTLQRHRTSYTLMLKALLKKPVVVFSFGIIYSLPVIVTSRYIFTVETLSLVEIIGILFFTNILFLTLAVPAGTRIASMLMPEVKRTLAPLKQTKIKGYTAMALLLVLMLFLHGRLVASLHYKSQILKANYTIDWSSFDYQVPTISQLFQGNALSNLSIDMVIDNPTEYDIVIEASQIFITKNELSIATVDLNGFEIPSKENRRVTLKIDSSTNINRLENVNDLLEGWRVDLQFELWPGIPFTLNLAH